MWTFAPAKQQKTTKNYGAETLVTLGKENWLYSTPNLKALEAIQDQYCPLEYDFYMNIYYHVPIGCFFMHFQLGEPSINEPVGIGSYSTQVPSRTHTKSHKTYGNPSLSCSDRWISPIL